MFAQDVIIRPVLTEKSYADICAKSVFHLCTTILIRSGSASGNMLSIVKLPGAGTCMTVIFPKGM